MKKRNSLTYGAAGILLFLGGCATTDPKTLTAVERVERIKESVDQTDEYIADARENIEDLEKNLVEIRKKAMASPDMRGKPAFQRALDDLRQRIAGAKADLNRLHQANQESFATFRQSVERAQSEMDRSFQESTRVSE